MWQRQVSEGCLPAAIVQAQTCPSLLNGGGAGSQGMSTEAGIALGMTHALGTPVGLTCAWCPGPIITGQGRAAAGLPQASLWRVGS